MYLNPLYVNGLKIASTREHITTHRGALISEAFFHLGGIVGDPDPEPDLDPHVFGPPGSGSTSPRYGSGSFPFLINVLSGLKQCLQNKNFNTKL